MERRSGLALALLAATGLAGCPEKTFSEFPLEVGYTMLEACEAELPPEIGSQSTLSRSMADGEIASGRRDGHSWAHGRAFVLAPVDLVWQALQDPCVSRIHTDRGFEPEPGEEGQYFPVSFRIRVNEDSGVPGIGNVAWIHTYRGGPVEEAPGGRSGYGMRYQKTEGIENVRVQSGSLEIFPALDDPENVTEVAYVHWLDADQTGVTQAEGAVNDWFMDLLGELGQLDGVEYYQGVWVKPEWRVCPDNGAGID